MPPQVSGTGPGNRSVVIQSQDGVNETKSGDLQKTPSRNQQDAKPNAARIATPTEKSQKNLEMSMEGSIQQTLLNEKIDAKTAQPECTSLESKKKGGKEKGTWLTEIAKIMGEAANKKAEKLKGSDSKTAEPKANPPQSTTTKGESFTSESLNNVIKTIGEGISTAARK